LFSRSERNGTDAVSEAVNNPICSHVCRPEAETLQAAVDGLTRALGTAPDEAIADRRRLAAKRQIPSSSVALGPELRPRVLHWRNGANRCCRKARTSLPLISSRVS